MRTNPTELWWCIKGEELLAALRRVAAGDCADIVYLELEAGSDEERSE